MRLLGDILTDIVGRRVLLVDDIVDTCRSITFAVASPRQRKIGELWMCALLNKPERRELDASLDFVGVRIGDVFVASCGIDHAEIVICLHRRRGLIPARDPEVPGLRRTRHLTPP